ncbi:MAG: hypothetical protein ACK5WZ_11850 [Pseudobdellovibrionaceae bacterium]
MEKNTKSIFSMMALLFTVVLISSCANNDDGGSKNASSPLDASCLNGSGSCNGAVYNQYPYSSYNHFTNGGFGANGWCGCPQGSLPVYNAINGPGCIQQLWYNQNIGFNAGFSFYFGTNWQPTPWAGYMNRTYAPNNSHYVNIPQISGYQGYPQGYAYGGNNSCAGRALQGCQINAQNSCPAQHFCRGTGPATHLGICINLNSL